MLRFIGYILVYDAQWLLMLDGDTLILLDVMKVGFTTTFRIFIFLFSLDFKNDFNWNN